MREINIKILDTVAAACRRLNSTNSSKEKQEVLGLIMSDNIEFSSDILRKALIFTYSPYITFGVTSDGIKKWMTSYDDTGDLFVTEMPIWDLLESLAVRELTGHDALRTICNTICGLPGDLKEVFYNIIDKNLKIRMDAKSINKVVPDLIPVFEVSLCNVYDDKKGKVNFEKDNWLASRKLDGCRCITIFDESGRIRFFSRQGKEFHTLSNLRRSLKDFAGNIKNMVIDGEICIIDEFGNEDFKSIMKEITRKDHTIRRPMYKVFDMMTLEEFESQSTKRSFISRYDDLLHHVRYYNDNCNAGYPGSKNPEPHMMELVEQIRVRDQHHFEEMFEESQNKKWEGLVIRKDDCTICKRSDSMLKVKGFQDAEYIVEGLDVGPFRVIASGLETEEDVMTRAFITHKGNRVAVGSGWSLEQRRYYKEHPEELIGKTITVQYFEETTDKDGNLSLRFPVCKCVYENGRDL